jgi:hypothetical protein
MKPQFIQLYLLGTMLTLSAVVNAQVSFAPTNNYAVGYNPSAVVAADVNGDGKWI